MVLYHWKQCLALGMSWMLVVKVTGQWTSLLFLRYTPVQLEEQSCASKHWDFYTEMFL